MKIYIHKRLVEQACLLVFLLSATFPPLMSFTFSVYIPFVSLLLWYCSSFIRKPTFYFNLRGLDLLITLVSSYTIIFPLFFSNNTFTNRYISIFLALSIIIILNFYQNDILRKEILKSSVKFVYITSSFTTIATLRELLINPYAARSIKNHGEYSSQLLASGIGGYTFIYYLVFACLLSLYILSSKKLQKKTRLFHLLFFIISLITILYSNYFTALIMLFSGIAVYLLSIIIRIRNKIIPIILIFLLLTVLFFYETIILSVCDLLLMIIHDGKNATRLLELREVIQGVNVTHSADGLSMDRFLRIINDIQQILQKPFFGILSSKLEMSGNYYTQFGQHSFIIDTFVLYGIPTGCVYIYILFKYYYIKLQKNYILTCMIALPMLQLITMNNFNLSIAVSSIFLFEYYLSYTKRKQYID